MEYDRHGVQVDDRLCTTNKRIYAAGYICSARKFTHLADALPRLKTAWPPQPASAKKK